ncbi:MAG TPA: glycosyltransferase family 4 protein [Xanthobacteraceae bacterium]|nr:glycosyltransferase family 4 protein [Xanthobacteraceae bacterium]
MRILQIHSGINLNGAVRYAALVSRLLALRGHEIVMLQRPVLDTGSVLALPDNIEVQISSLQRLPGEVRRVGRLCREKRIDVIHTHKSSAHAFGALLRLFYGVPCVATAHSLNYQLHWVVNDRVVCHNEESMRFMHNRNFVPRRKLRQVPAFVDEFYLAAAAEEPGATRRRLGVGEGRKMLVTVGNVERRKGVADIIEALPLVSGAGIDACVVVAGWFHSIGYRAEVEERVRALGVEDRVSWLEGASDQDIGHLLRAADLYVQASHVETGPLVVLEAMALGLPVVGTFCGSMPDFILPGVTGELVPPGKPQALAAAVVHVLADPERARAMGREGRERFAAQFSAEVNIPKLEVVLAEAAARA